MGVLPMAESVRQIELELIRPSRLNPRLEINIERLNELAESIREVGLLEPIIVRPVGDKFEVVVGERRYRASQQAGLARIPAVVREYADDDVVQLNLIENIQREDLSAVEKGKVCKYLMENCSAKFPSQGAVAKRLGVSSDTISLWLRTVEVVPEEVQKLVAPSTASGEVPEGRIDYLTAVKVGRSVKEPERKIEVIKKLAERHLPTKQKKKVIEKIVSEPERPIEEVIKDVEEAPFELPFLANDKELLLSGKKTQTSITSLPDSRIKAGARVRAVINEPHVADLLVTAIERKKLKYFDEEDAEREGGYKLGQFKKIWERLHGSWDDSQLVYVIRFERMT